VGVENILKNPVDSISTNYHGSEVILNAANKFDKRIIIASTSEIYGKNNSQPLSENDDRVIGVPQKLRWTYSDAKALEEAIAHSLYLSNNLRVTTIRLFNTVGPRQTGKYGMVIPRFVKSALENKPLNIFGNGSQSRVFCHVLDTARAIIDLSVNSNTYGEVFNIGGEGEVTVFDLAKLIIEITNSSSKIVFSAYEDVFPVGYEDMQRRVPDISKIRNFIGWKPLFDLRKIIEDVAQSLS
jgi:UDP-glucose 4-epimerase